MVNRYFFVGIMICFLLLFAQCRNKQTVRIQNGTGMYYLIYSETKNDLKTDMVLNDYVSFFYPDDVLGVTFSFTDSSGRYLRMVRIGEEDKHNEKGLKYIYEIGNETYAIGKCLHKKVDYLSFFYGDRAEFESFKTKRSQMDYGPLVDYYNYDICNDVYYGPTN